MSLPTAEQFRPTLGESRKYFESRLGRSLPDKKKEVPAKCIFHSDKTASMSINLAEGTWYCHTCHVGGGLLDFERKLTGKPDSECWSAINATIGRPERKAAPFNVRTIFATYDYLLADSKLAYQGVRYEPKGFAQRRPDGRGSWIWDMRGVTRVPFNLPAVVRANVVLIAEGEKDALNLQKAAVDFVELHRRSENGVGGKNAPSANPAPDPDFNN